MYRLLKAKNAALQDQVVEFARELIQTPSSSLREAEVGQKVEQRMNKLGYDEVFHDEAGNVIGVMFGRETGPTVLLNSHMDTVEPGDREVWTDDPYSGKIEDGFLYGRGASDCKAGLAAQIYAGALLKRSLLPLRGNLIVAATVAEENGPSVGVRALLEKTLPEMELKPDFAILGEPTELGLYYGHDGWLETDIEIKGANPFQVDSAAAAVFNELEKTCRWRSALTTDREEMLVDAPRFRDDQGLRLATVRLERRLQTAENVDAVLSDLSHSASLVARAAGSVAVQAMIRVDRQRLHTGQTTVVRRVTQAWATDPFHPLLQRARQVLAAAGCEAAPAEWKLGRLGMGTAGGVMVNEFGLPAIGYGPGSEAFAHAPNECVAIDKIAECVYGTAAAAHGLVGIPVFGWTADEI